MSDVPTVAQVAAMCMAQAAAAAMLAKSGKTVTPEDLSIASWECAKAWHEVGIASGAINTDEEDNDG